MFYETSYGPRNAPAPVARYSSRMLGDLSCCCGPGGAGKGDTPAPSSPTIPMWIIYTALGIGAFIALKKR